MRRLLYTAAGLCLAQVLGLGLVLGADSGQAESQGRNLRLIRHHVSNSSIRPPMRPRKRSRRKSSSSCCTSSGNFEDPTVYLKQR